MNPPPQAELERLLAQAELTPAQFRLVMGVSRQTEIRWRRKKKVPFRKSGRFIFYPTDAVRDFRQATTTRARSFRTGSFQTGTEGVPQLSNQEAARLERLISEQTASLQARIEALEKRIAA